MKNYLKNCSELTKMLLLASLIGAILISCSTIGIVYGQPGWIIGVTAGTAVELLNIFLLYKGSEVTLKYFKSYLFLLMYFSRMVLLITGLLVFVMLQYYFNVEFFTNSFWGFLIGIGPMTIIVIVVMALSGKSPIDIAEKKEEK